MSSLNLKHSNKASSSPEPDDFDDEYHEYIQRIQHIYKNKIQPLEVTYNFEGFHSSPLTPSDIAAKPIVLLVGQYSTGKTTFIRYLLDKAYPGEHIGVEPTTDRFVAVMHDNEDRVIPGNAAAVNQELPFRGLNRFGQAFLSRFQVSQTSSPVLENMTIIDTPGILAGDKQTVERGYDFTQVIHWFAQRADLILLMFDSHKLDISNEFRMAIDSLRGQEEKVRVVLNKSDMVSQQQLMRVYGAMMWSLGKVVQTPEVMRVFLGSFWSERPPNCFDDCRDLIEAESKDLLKDLKTLKRQAVMRKVNEIIKRARLARVHALIISHLKKEMPAMFGKKKKQESLLANLDQEFIKLQQRYHIPAGDFPNVDKFRQALSVYDMDKFKPMKEDLLLKVDEALNVDLPSLISQLPVGNPTLNQHERNPFDLTNDEPNETPVPSSNPWQISANDKAHYQTMFSENVGSDDKLSGTAAKSLLMQSGLPNDVLAQIWRLSDLNTDGALDVHEFAIAMHLAKIVSQDGISLPEKLPFTLLP
ncbi:P-loop containing nucleoside triphosphate hydrolase protein [Halteromyces radiatus]|uniref:P-loop containing nucleoside triphosphate hydrolase protein n=1 Tax=Halteromyces radiatus TaxID=101107 RepID=UPI00222074DA|nr:P-loop containing nucleoside triphosphate hydrolase protein [Halteromyces radiatus]KAI8098949.1 P-loop containing nucleoside triphosphate hydrolase protein [Halteromyces radiatus]